MLRRYRTSILVVALLFTTASVTVPAKAFGGYYTLTRYWVVAPGGNACPPAYLGQDWTEVGERENFCGGGISYSGTQAGDWRTEDYQSCWDPPDAGQDVFEYCASTNTWYQYHGTCVCH